MVVYFNEGTFQLDDFGQSRIKKRSVLKRMQVDETRPNWISTTVNKNLLIDGSNYLHYGLDDEAVFTTITFDPARPSASTAWPINPQSDNVYKFSSITLQFGQDRTLIERRTYGTLDWLSDCGGLLFALAVLAYIVVTPIANYKLKTLLLSQLYKYVIGFEEQEPKTDKASEDASISMVENHLLSSQPVYDNEDFQGDQPENGTSQLECLDKYQEPTTGCNNQKMQGSGQKLQIGIDE